MCIVFIIALNKQLLAPSDDIWL